MYNCKARRSHVKESQYSVSRDRRIFEFLIDLGGDPQRPISSCRTRLLNFQPFALMYIRMSPHLEALIWLFQTLIQPSVLKYALQVENLTPSASLRRFLISRYRHTEGSTNRHTYFRIGSLCKRVQSHFYFDLSRFRNSDGT